MWGFRSGLIHCCLWFIFFFYGLLGLYGLSAAGGAAVPLVLTVRRPNYHSLVTITTFYAALPDYIQHTTVMLRH